LGLLARLLLSKKRVKETRGCSLYVALTELHAARLRAMLDVAKCLTNHNLSLVFNYIQYEGSNGTCEH
jgi:hypothetical protein